MAGKTVRLLNKTTNPIVLSDGTILVPGEEGNMVSAEVWAELKNHKITVKGEDLTMQEHLLRSNQVVLAKSTGAAAEEQEDGVTTKPVTPGGVTGLDYEDAKKAIAKMTDMDALATLRQSEKRADYLDLLETQMAKLQKQQGSAKGK